jgi:CspA family cold shock protein
MKGKVRWFNLLKGYGFIEVEDGDDIFVHQSQLKGELIHEGDNVEFEIEETDRGKNAVKVKKIE